MDRTADPRIAVERLTATMLHRTPFLHEPGQPLGVGALPAPVPGSRGEPGYVVLWAGEALTSKTFPVVVPGAGQEDVPREIVPEIPTPARDVAFYDRPRAYPVSVGFLPAGTKDVRIRVRKEGERADLEGDLFTPEGPVHPSFAHNYATAFFVAREPFERKTAYDASFEATVDGVAVSFVWRFQTIP